MFWTLDPWTLDPVALARGRCDGARKHSMAPGGALMGQTFGSSKSQGTNKPKQSQQHMFALHQAKHPSMLAKHPSNTNFGNFL